MQWKRCNFTVHILYEGKAKFVVSYVIEVFHLWKFMNKEFLKLLMKISFSWMRFSRTTLQIFTPWKLRGLGITGSLQGKPALSMEKGCKNHKETLCMLWINPVIFTDCGKPHDNYRISPKSVNITGFPHNRENLQRPCNICSVENLNNIHISLPEWILLVRVTAILFYVA